MASPVPELRRAVRRGHRTRPPGPRYSGRRAASGRPAGSRPRGPRGRPRGRPAAAPRCCRGVGGTPDRGDPGDGSKRGPPIVQRVRLVQIGDALLGDDVGDVVAVDHHRRQRHAGLLADVDGVQGLDEGGHASGPEGLGHLHHQLAPASTRRRRRARGRARRPTSGGARAGRGPCSGPRRNRTAGRR